MAVRENEAAGRLAAFEAMLADVRRELEEVTAQQEALRSQGKAKTATYQQLFARKMTLQQFLSIYERHGLL